MFFVRNIRLDYALKLSIFFSKLNISPHFIPILQSFQCNSSIVILCLPQFSFCRGINMPKWKKSIAWNWVFFCKYYLMFVPYLQTSIYLKALKFLLWKEGNISSKEPICRWIRSFNFNWMNISVFYYGFGARLIDKIRKGANKN